MPVKLPVRIPLGQMIIGPDHYGCINTGLAPTILHSRALSVSSTAFRGYRFVIGPRIYVERAVLALIQDRVPAGQAFVEFEKGARRVTFTRTYATAKKRFAFLVAEIEAANRKQAEAHKALERLAKTGSLEDALRAICGLGDY